MVEAERQVEVDEDITGVTSHLTEMRVHAEAFTEYVNILYERSDKEKLAELASLRRFSVRTLEKQQVFYVPKSAASLMLPKFQDNLRSFGVISERNKPVFYDRWIFPIKNSIGQVINLVGYSNTAPQRYLFGKAPFFDRKNTLFGLENLNFVEDSGCAAIVEGITDAIRLRDIGFKAVFAMCGTGSSTIKCGVINRRASLGVICIPDRDEPGKRAVKKWDFNNRHIIWVDARYKDIDEMCREHPNGVKAVKDALVRAFDNLALGGLSGAETVRLPD